MKTKFHPSAGKIQSNILLIAIAVFFSRIPFLYNGYGNDPDAWEVARAASKIALTGTYSVSRLPGYPLQEILYSLIWNVGPFGFNLLSATLSVVSFVFFALILKRGKSKNYIIGALALVFTPIIYISSTNSMDYIWALTFLLGSMYFVLLKRPLVAGAFLGLAIGCRITSAVMVLPLVLMQISQDQKFVIRRISLFCISSGLIGFLSYFPVISRYGLDFFTFYQGKYPEIIKVAYKLSVGVWGAVGSLTIFFALIYLVFFNTLWKEQIKTMHPTDLFLVLSWFLVIVIYVILYFRLPYESGYLVPIVPFVLLLFDRFLNGKKFIFLCVFLTVSSFAISIDKSGLRPLGPIFSDYIERQQTAQLVESVFSFDNIITTPTVIIAGYELPIITKTSFDRKINMESVIEYVLSAEQIISYQSNGYQVYYLPKMREYNIKVEGVDPIDYQALPFESIDN